MRRGAVRVTREDTDTPVHKVTENILSCMPAMLNKGQSSGQQFTAGGRFLGLSPSFAVTEPTH